MTKISVQSEGFSFYAPSNSVHSDIMFSQASYTVHLETEVKSCSFTIQPSEWLRAYTKFLKSESDSFRVHLSLSGEYFAAERSDDGILLHVFDLNSCSARSFRVSDEEGRQLHHAILAQIESDLKSVCGRDAVLEDAELFAV
ncbi:hypothetical protein [Henriciella litoralis]|uniref:hypothetical protein n=1 Tax=Henriciella litoralis TaxID=568102 RepID=UPI0009FEDDAB|nr:hypothetical protein [Henriciella litoralis]